MCTIIIIQRLTIPLQMRLWRTGGRPSYYNRSGGIDSSYILLYGALQYYREIPELRINAIYNMTHWFIERNHPVQYINNYNNMCSRSVGAPHHIIIVSSRVQDDNNTSVEQMGCTLCCRMNSCEQTSYTLLSECVGCGCAHIIREAFDNVWTAI